MKNIKIAFLVFFMSGLVNAQYTAIPDIEFENMLISQGIDTEGIQDGQVLTSDINMLIDLDISIYYQQHGPVIDLTGIEDFIALEHLNCAGNSITEIVLTSNTNLKILNCNHNELTILDVSDNLLLEELYCGNPAIDVGPFNQIPSLDLSNNVNLEILECILLWELTALDLSQNVNLEELYCGFTQITDLDVTQNTDLRVLNVDYCHLTHLNLVNNTALTHLTVTTDFPMIPQPNSNQIQSLDLSNNPALETLWVEDSIIEELNLKNGANNIWLMLHAAQNPNLFCITVDDEVAANAGDFPYSEWHVDPQVFYSENCVIGIDDIEGTQIDIFPNPVKDFLYVENAPETITEIEVLDLLGKIVRIKTKDFNEIDLSSFKPGVYFVKLFVGNAVLTKKIIKK